MPTAGSLTDEALLVSASAAFLTALGGFFVVLRRLRHHGDVLEELSTAEQVEAGFKRNESEHEEIRNHLDSVQTTVRTNTGRLEQHRVELERLWRVVEGFELLDEPPDVTEVS